MATGNIRTPDVNYALDALVTNWGTLEIGLSTTQPVLTNGVVAGQTEPSGGGYARVSLPTSGWSAAANRVKVNSVDIQFNSPTSTWGFIGYVVAFKSGVPVWYGTLTAAANIVAGGQALRIPAGTLSIAFPAN
jgi:hypothetical protein